MRGRLLLLEKVVEGDFGLDVVPVAVVLESVCTNWQPYIYWFPKLSNFTQLWKRIAMFANAQGGDLHYNTLRKMCVTRNGDGGSGRGVEEH